MLKETAEDLKNLYLIRKTDDINEETVEMLPGNKIYLMQEEIEQSQITLNII